MSKNMTIAEFIKQHRLTMSTTRANGNPHLVADDGWSRSASHWKCTIKRGSRRMTVPFSQGSAHADAPTLESVLDCLGSDSATYLNARSFEEWASELGYDTDSRKAEHTYHAIEKQLYQLRRVLGPDEVNDLAFNTERL